MSFCGWLFKLRALLRRRGGRFTKKERHTEKRTQWETKRKNRDTATRIGRKSGPFDHYGFHKIGPNRSTRYCRSHSPDRSCLPGPRASLTKTPLKERQGRPGECAPNWGPTAVAQHQACTEFRADQRRNAKCTREFDRKGASLRCAWELAENAKGGNTRAGSRKGSSSHFGFRAVW